MADAGVGAGVAADATGTIARRKTAGKRNRLITTCSLRLHVFSALKGPFGDRGGRVVRSDAPDGKVALREREHFG